MPNYLEAAANHLMDAFERDASETVEYWRRGSFVQSMTAVPGRTPIETQDHDGMILRDTVKDFTIRQTNFAGWVPPQPLRGDEIVQTINGKRHVYTVNGENLSSSHYEEADSYGVAWRIHTKLERIE